MNLQDQAGFSGAHTAATLVLDAGATTYDLDAMQWAIDGRNYKKTAVSNGASGVPASGALVALTPTTGFLGALVVCTIDTGATVRFRSKGFVASAAGAPLELSFPEIPLTELPIAYFTLKGGTTISTSWTFGTSNWDATGMTASATVSLCGLPTGGIVLS
jgi:hypothetical protein